MVAAPIDAAARMIETGIMRRAYRVSLRFAKAVWAGKVDGTETRHA